MTSQNFLNLARSGEIDMARPFRDAGGPASYCIAASLDRLFVRTDVPASIYQQNDELFQLPEDRVERAIDRLHYEIGQVLFKGAEDGEGLSYYFDTFQEFDTDLTALRQARALVLIDTRDGHHVNGLQPVGDEDWRIVGQENLICVYSDESGLDVQHVYATAPAMTTREVWEYMRANNSPDFQQTALVFPPEPA